MKLKTKGKMTTTSASKEATTTTMMMTPRYKLVVVGDGNCGKTSLLSTYIHQAFPEIYVPTIFETHLVDIQVDSVEHHHHQKVSMVLWDTAGQENYDMLRPISYPSTDVFVVCFAVDSPDSFYNVTRKWIPEVRHFSTTVPVVLVATKTDLRTDSKTVDRLAKCHQGPISMEDGLALAQTIGASCVYVECSAKGRDGVEDVFQRAASASIRSRQLAVKPNQRQCIIL